MSGSQIQNRSTPPMPMAPVVTPEDIGATPSKSQAKDSSREAKSFADELSKEKAPDPRDLGKEPPKSQTNGSAGSAKDAAKDAKSHGADAKTSAASDAAAKGGEKAGAKDAKASSGKEAKAAQLAPLKRAATQNKQAIDDSPVVAFLTGRLDKLNPADIPSLVSGNDFLAEALGEADLDAFLNSPSDIEDLVSDLDLPDSLLVDAQVAGLDPSSAFAATDILKAIGVDPQRVFAELSQLKDNLRMEGVKPYMTRAAVLGGAKGKLKDQLFGSEGVPAGQTSERREAVPLMSPSVLSNSAPAGAEVAAPSMMERITQPDARLGMQNTNLFSTPGTSLVGPSPLAMPIAAPVGLSPSMAEGPVALLGGTPSDTVLDASTASRAPLLRSALLEVSESTSELPLAAIAGKSEERGSMRYATHDPFESLGRELSRANTIRLGSEQVKELPLEVDSVRVENRSEQTTVAAPREALAEQLVRQQFSGALPTAPQSLMPQIVTPQAAQVPAAAPAVIPNARLADVSMPTRQEARVVSETTRPEVASRAPKSMPIEELRLVKPLAALSVDAVLPGSKRDEGAGDRSSQQKDGGRGGEPSFGSSERGLAFMMDAAKSNAFAGEAFKVDAPKTEFALSPAERADMVKQIYERATMLSQEGGGMVRLELGSAGLGRLEMAVSLSDDRVDLRILTGSTQLRDSVAQELGRLRDALSAQSLTLGNVDVGTSTRQQHQHAEQQLHQQRNAFAHLGGDAQQQQQQMFERQQAMRDLAEQLGAGLSGRGRAAERVIPRTTAIVPPALRQAPELGRLAIRV